MLGEYTQVMSDMKVYRREMVRGMGVLAVGLVGFSAGCLGSGDESESIGPVYESGSIGSAGDGDGGTNPLFGSGNLELLGAVLSRENGVVAVRGRVKNISRTTMGNVRTEVQFLNENEAVIEQSLDVVQDLASDQVWKFEVPYPGSEPETVAAATITDIINYSG